MSRKTMVPLVALLAILLICTVGSSRGRILAQEQSRTAPQALPPADDPAPQGQVGPAAAVTPLLQYQGRLTDPATGDPVADGTYQISFRLYDVEVGGTPLWTETEDVPVAGGLFTNVLGDSTPLDPGLFGGQMLWLGIKVGADAEAAPRQPVLPVAYALSLVPGAVVGGPIQVAGDLDVAGSLTGAHASNPSAHHTRYTDPEAWNTVLSRDGPLSGLNADLLDGSHASSFASSSHTHTGSQIVDNSLDYRDLADLTRKISFPAHALNYAPGTVISDYGSGLRWQQNYGQGAYVMLSAPEDWDGSSNVTMYIYFFTIASGSGNVDFFIRPRAFNAGDSWADASSLSGTPVSVSSIYQIGRQAFSIPASRFGTKDLWVITLQRQGSGSTYTGDVVVVAVVLTYNAVR